jgi:hypothetical protein
VSHSKFRMSRDRVMTCDMILGLLFAMCGLALINAVTWYGGLPAVGITSTAVLLALLVIAWRRYLREVEFDLDSGEIRAKSILPIVSFSFPLAALTAVHMTPNVSRVHRDRYNVVFRCRRRIQPLLFEVVTDAEDEQARLVVAQILGALGAWPEVSSRVASDQETGNTARS